MTKFRDQDYALYPKTGGGRWFKTEQGERDGRAWRSTEGLVETPHGFIRAYSSYLERGYQSSQVEMLRDGRHHWRRFDKEFTARGLVTKAKQFAAELYG